MPERDPDHPTSSGESGRDRRDTRSRRGDRGDDRVVNELDAIAARVDPVPDAVVEEARRAFKTRRAKNVGAKKVAPRGSSGRDPA
ncbi:MAG: hypothetical protein QOF28_3239 [Actinomycetota bacterium]|nr:hypothetical protein [Actinomycetota bacterium]